MTLLNQNLGHFRHNPLLRTPELTIEVDISFKGTQNIPLKGRFHFILCSNKLKRQKALKRRYA